MGEISWDFVPSQTTGEFLYPDFISCGRPLRPDHYEVRVPTPPFTAEVAGFRLLREQDGEIEVADVVLPSMRATQLVAQTIDKPQDARYAIEAFDLAGNTARSDFVAFTVPGCRCVSTDPALPLGLLALLGLGLIRRR